MSVYADFLKSLPVAFSRLNRPISALWRDHIFNVFECGPHMTIDINDVNTTVCVWDPSFPDWHTANQVFRGVRLTFGLPSVIECGPKADAIKNYDVSDRPSPLVIVINLLIALLPPAIIDQQDSDKLRQAYDTMRSCAVRINRAPENSSEFQMKYPYQNLRWYASHFLFKKPFHFEGKIDPNDYTLVTNG